MIRREYKGVNRVSLSDLQASSVSCVQITDVFAVWSQRSSDEIGVTNLLILENLSPEAGQLMAVVDFNNMELL